MTYEAPIRIRLAPGQAWRVAVDARTSVQVLWGRVVLREVPAWVAGGLHAAGILLAEGQAHRLAQAGWIEVAALEEAEVLGYRQPGPVAQALRAWTARLGSFPDGASPPRPTAAFGDGVQTGPWSWISSKARLSCWPFAGSRR